MAVPPKATLTIPNGQTASDTLILETSGARRPYTLTFYSPTTLPETVTVQASDTVGGTSIALQSAGSDITLPANKATVIVVVLAAEIKLVAGSGVGADRAFTVLASALR